MRKPKPPPEHLAHMTHDELVRMWHEQDLTERERAGVETALWALAPKDMDRPRFKAASTYLASCFGNKMKPARIERRRFLYSVGVFADPLWERIEKERMTTGTAISLFRAAKKAARGKAFALASMLQKQLEAYDRGVGEAASIRTESGVVRRKKTSRLRTPEEVSKSPRRSAKNTLGKDFFAEIRDLCSKYVSENLSALDPDELERHLREFGADVNIFLLDFRKRVRSLKGRAGDLDGFRITTATGKVSRRKLLDACTILNMDPPKPNAPVDMDYAKKRMKSRARVLHPDASGHEETRRSFEAVMEAYGLVQLYNEELTASTQEPQEPIEPTEEPVDTGESNAHE